VEDYHRLLESADLSVRARAAKNWTEWEWALSSVERGRTMSGRWQDPAFQLARARIVTHYFRNAAWLSDGQLLREAGSLAGIPGIIINGRLDVQAPLRTAWELAHAWPHAELVIVEGAGHSTSDRGMNQAIVAATDRFARGARSESAAT
jgi:proline iminopeptidase